jgi:phosphatidylserine/phosphatidylglycerophosphate/cardiolipin synthase-like enzyme
MPTCRAVLTLLLSALVACHPCPTDSAGPGSDSDPLDSATDSLPEKDTAQDSGEDTGPVEPVELLPEHFSAVGQAALAALDRYPGSRYVTWNYSADAVFDEGWILQTPEPFHWGQPADSFEGDVGCDDAGCDPDFELRYCLDQGDCVDGGRCQPVAASVVAPGEEPLSMCVDHSAALWDGLYETLVMTTDYADVASLTAPDGRFEAALRNALSYLHNSGSQARIRVLFGNIPGVGLDPWDVVDGLARDLPDDTPLMLHVATFHDDYYSWNHAKIVAADGVSLLQGGHNMWHHHYLTTAPIHDLSMRVDGAVAGDAQRFLDRQWEYACEDHWVDGWTERATFPDGVDDCPPPWSGEAQIPYEGGPRVISTARLGTLGEDPADEALLAMIRAAEHSVYLSLQDVGPIRLLGDWSLSDWPQDFFAAVAHALVHGVSVSMVLSSPDSVPGGLSAYEGGYHNGWTTAEVAQALEAWFEENPGVAAADQDVHQLICEGLGLAWLRFSEDDSWAEGIGVGNHSKMFIVDEQAFYIGSQNLYPADLQEFGLIVDDPSLTAELLSAYWEPLWEHSKATTISGPESEHCSF